MLTYELMTEEKNVKRRMPYYEYLYRRIREDIQKGSLKAGDPLPSKRTFAKHLGLSVITVENAYAQLLTEGYVISKPRKGFYVADLKLQRLEEINPTSRGSKGGEGYIGEGRTFEMPSASLSAGSSASSSVISPADLPAESREKVVADFSSNQAQPDAFPFPTWARLTREVLSSKREELMRNAPPGGVFELRREISAYLRSFRGIEADPGQIIIGAGTEYLYGLLIQLLGFDLVYAAENPGYRKVSEIFASYRVSRRLVDMDQKGITAEGLQAQSVDVVHVTPSHHFPTGITMPAARRYELLRWAEGSRRRYIIEDDYDSEFRMNGRPLPALFSMDRSQKVIYLNTFTKSLCSTIRVSYMVLPGHLAKRFKETMGFYSSTVSNSIQYTLAAFLKEGYFEKHINRMRTASRRKRDIFLRAIKESALAEIASVSEPDAGLHFLMNLTMEGKAQPLVDSLREQGVVMVRLKDFFYGEKLQEELGVWNVGDADSDHTFLMNYSSVPEEHLVRAVKIIADQFSEGREERRGGTTP